MEHRKYGWVRDLPDARDFKYKIVKGISLPSEVDLRKAVYPIVDQKDLGSCTACGVGNVDYAVQHIQGKQNTFYPSRLFIYYNTRALEDSINHDSGATIRNTIKAIAKWGACREEIWEYYIPKFTHKPDDKCYVEAEQNQAIKYESVPQNLYSLKTVLAEGFPIVGGIAIYDSFETDRVKRGGIVPMPNMRRESLQGGHAIALYGYSDKNQWFIGMNSWGSGWGDGGYFFIPYSYITNRGLAADFWTIKLVE